MRKYLVIPLLLLSSFLLAGCHSPSVLKGSGEVAPTPIGHELLCIQQPTFPGCPK